MLQWKRAAMVPSSNGYCLTMVKYSTGTVLQLIQNGSVLDWYSTTYIIVLVPGHEELGHVDGEDVGEQLLVVRLQKQHTHSLQYMYVHGYTGMDLVETSFQMPNPLNRNLFRGSYVLK
jgi:hypothetical protein